MGELGLAKKSGNAKGDVSSSLHEYSFKTCQIFPIIPEIATYNDSVYTVLVSFFKILFYLPDGLVYTVLSASIL